MADDDDLANRFTYHPPKPGQPPRYELIRHEGLKLAKLPVPSRG